MPSSADKSGITTSWHDLKKLQAFEVAFRLRSRQFRKYGMDKRLEEVLLSRSFRGAASPPFVILLGLDHDRLARSDLPAQTNVRRKATGGDYKQ